MPGNDDEDTVEKQIEQEILQASEVIKFKKRKMDELQSMVETINEQNEEILQLTKRLKQSTDSLDLSAASNARSTNNKVQHSTHDIICRRIMHAPAYSTGYSMTSL